MSLATFDLQHAPCGIFTFGEDLILLDANQTLADMLGRPHAELVGLPLDHLLTPANRLMLHMQTMVLLQLSGRADEIYFSLAGANGQEVPVLFNAVRRRLDSGAITECIVFPIRKRKLLEDELFKVKKAAEQMPGAIFQFLRRTNGTSCFPYASENIRTFFGVSPLQLQHSSAQFFQVIHPDDRCAVQQAMEVSAADLSPWNQTYRVNLPRRGLRWLEGHAVPESRADGSVLWHGYVSDVSERKTLETTLARSHERTQVTLRSIGDAVITTNEAAQVDYLNPVAERLTGWCQSAAEGQPVTRIFNIVHQKTRLPAVNPITRCLLERQIVEVESDIVLINASGLEYAVENSAAPILNIDGSISGAVIVFRDVTDQRKQHKETEHRANHDHLTGLPNRAEFDRLIQQLFVSAQAGRAQHALCYIDLDYFKTINDSCGHAAGDLLLQQVSALLLSCVRSKDTVARLGGDEFALLLDNCNLAAAQRIAEKVCQRLTALPFLHNDALYPVSASIGVTVLGQHWDNLQAAKQAADNACFAAKLAGRNRACVYQPPA
jgi:diguanylate cyclase (GGDEF)-like protein/PAS domain S-box-containing protein